MSFLLGLTEPWGYVLIGLLAAGEGALLIGLFLPGEASMLLGGVLVYQGRAALGIMLLAASSGAVIGDSIGYWIGRRLGPMLRAGPLGRKVGEARWERANGYVRRRGGRAVFFGRFVGVLRALLPTIAGQAPIPYGTFLVYNAAGGILWAVSFVILGVLAGGSWHIVERWAGRASLIVLTALAVAVGLVLLARWAGGNRAALQARLRQVQGSPRVQRLRRLLGPQIAFVKRRLDRRQRFGLYMTLGLVTAVLGAWAFAAVLEAVLGRDDVALVDRPVARLMVSHREAWLTTVMKAVTFLGSGAFVAALLGLAAVSSYLRWRQTRWPAFFAATLVGALSLDDILKVLVGRPRPHLVALVEVSGSSFPSGHATASAAAFWALAFVLARRRGWRWAVWIWTGASFLAILVASSRVYLGVQWPTDVMAGFFLGGFWTGVTATATAAWPRSEGGEGSPGWG
ncbi:MAG: bifunctional DedA family/phosphatase PAP2 family protein [Actinomycetota bacterium]